MLVGAHALILSLCLYLSLSRARTHKHTSTHTHKCTALRNLISNLPIFSGCFIYNQVSHFKQIDILVTTCIYMFHTDPRKNNDLWSTQYWLTDTETGCYNIVNNLGRGFDSRWCHWNFLLL